LILKFCMERKVFCFFWSNGCSYHAQNLISSSIERHGSIAKNPKSLRCLIIEISWWLTCLFACLFACLQKVNFSIFSAMPEPISILFLLKDAEFPAQSFVPRTFLAILLHFLTKCEKLVSQSEQIQYIHTWIRCEYKKIEEII
jgi:hypothetical protein